MFLNDLPAELQLAIVRQLDRESLKSLRCSCKSVCPAASALLFETVHISPNVNSLDRAGAVCILPHLSPLVKSIVFHIGVLEEVQGGFESFRTQVLRLDPTNDVTEDIVWKYNCFLEEVAGQESFEDRDEDDELRYLCRHLVNLEAISTIHDEYDNPFALAQDYVGRRTGAHAAHPAEGSHFSSLLIANAGRKLQRVSALSASWHCLRRIREKIGVSNLCDIFSRVKELRIGLDNFEYLNRDDVDQEEYVSGLQDILRAAGNIQYLHLDFDELPFGTDAQDLLPISRCLLELMWPSLARLDLMGIVVTEDNFMNILQKHSRTLRHLHLDDIEITGDSSSSIPGSILSLFSWISQALTLESITLTGNFTNRHDEAWYVDTESDVDDSIVGQIEKWLTRRGDSPLPPKILERRREPYSDDPDDTSDVNSDEDMEDDGCPKPEDWWDESWMFCPELTSVGDDMDFD